MTSSSPSTFVTHVDVGKLVARCEFEMVGTGTGLEAKLKRIQLTVEARAAKPGNSILGTGLVLDDVTVLGEIVEAKA